MQAIKKRLLALADQRASFELIKAFESLFNTQCLTAAALTGGASATPTLGNAITAMVGGVAVSKAAASAFTLNGPTVLTATSQVYMFLMDAAGTLSVLPGVPAATLAGVQWPIVPELTSGAGALPVVVGSMTLTNTSGAAFTPNVTALNTANLGIVFNNPVGPFFPIQIL